MATRGDLLGPEWERVNRAPTPLLRGPAPALLYPVENANVIRNKAVILLNRAGSHPGNPILAGLGMRLSFEPGLRDRLTGIFIFQDRRLHGVNLKSQAGSGGPGIYTLDVLVGSGQSVAGSPVSGAVRNFLRWQTAFGADEKEFWAKTMDADIVNLNGLPALDPVTLLAVERTAQIVDDSRTWLDVPIDFFVSWGDEFAQLHRLITDGTPENGFQKSYGGAAFVSFFDTTPGTEGVGTAVNPVTQAAISSQQIIQVQNTAGLKQITVRFRSKQLSSWFVDVPILIRVLAAPAGSCLPPVDLPCGQMLLKKGSALPSNFQSAASVPGIQDVAGTPGNPTDRDLWYLSVHEAIVGGTANLLVRKWKTVPSSTDLGGADLVQVGGDLEFLPLRGTAATPNPGPPYGTPQMLTVAFDVAADRAALVAFYTVQVKDGHNLSPAQLFMGPRARDFSFYPAGESGATTMPCVSY